MDPCKSLVSIDVNNEDSAKKEEFVSFGIMVLLDNYAIFFSLISSVFRMK